MAATHTAGTTPSSIVGVGASAGGLEALEKFFENIPEEHDLSFVVIQHLSPDYKSLMVELLSKHTRMQVQRVEDGMPVRPREVYLIPPKTNLTIRGGQLRLTEQNPRQGLNLPIDVFFRSLAEEMEDRAIVVILSGTGSDGTRGLRAVKEKNGMVMVQSEESARFNGMPGSAIRTGLADFILRPEEMGVQLVNYVNHPFVSQSRNSTDDNTNEEQISRIVGLLRRQTGVDFSSYKPSTVLRRIERRMGIAQVDSLEDYTQYLYQSRQEVSNLYRDLLIGVTKFFRDNEAHQILRDKAIDALLKDPPNDGVIRCWVVGCATGEEAYTVAMLLHDRIEQKSQGALDFKIFATDIDKEALEIASNGHYPESIAADVPAEYLRQYFDPKDGGYQIRRSLRDRVIFATQNILRDPPFTRIDLLTCRNLLIYLKASIQQRILGLFHFALRPNGYLLLGSSETVGDLHEAFEPVDSKWRLYHRRGTFSPALTDTIRVASTENLPSVRRHAGNGVSSGAAQSGERASMESRVVEAIQDKALSQHVPATFVVDQQLELFHSFGRRLPFLSMPQGKASLNFLRMLPKDLALAVSTATGKCIRDGQPVHFRDVITRYDEKTYSLNVSVEKDTSDIAPQALYLVSISQHEKLDRREFHENAENQGESFEVQDEANERINVLEKELQYTRENLQATIEELETSNEELQATNEELLAANEELQSTNEELESVNEELYTVNSEYQGKIGELTELNNDIDNLLRSSDVGTIFLDAGLCIRKFTPAVVREIPLRQHDLGRPLNEISHPLIEPILQRAREVLEGGEAREFNLQGKSDRWYLLSAVPYLAPQNRREGVVVNVVDITTLRRAQENLERSQERLAAILEAIEVGVCVTDEHGRFEQVNDAYCRIYGYDREELVGQPFTLVVPPDYQEQAQKIHDDFIAGGSEIDSEWNVVRKDGTVFPITTRARRLQHGDEPARKVTVVTDVSELRAAEQARDDAKKELSTLTNKGSDGT